MKHGTVSTLVLLIGISHVVLAQSSTGKKGGYGATCLSKNDCSPDLYCEFKNDRPPVCTCKEMTAQCAQHAVNCQVPTSNLSQWQCDVLAPQLLHIESIQVIDGATSDLSNCTNSSSCLYNLPQPMPEVPYRLVVNLIHKDGNATPKPLSFNASSYSVECSSEITSNGMRKCGVSGTQRVVLGSLTVHNSNYSCQNSSNCQYPVPDLPPMTNYSIDVLLLVNTTDGKTSNYMRQLYDFTPPVIVAGSLTQISDPAWLSLHWVQNGSVEEVAARIYSDNRSGVRTGVCSQASADNSGPSMQNVTCHWTDLEAFLNYSTVTVDWRPPGDNSWRRNRSFVLPSPYFYPNLVRGVDISNVSSVRAVVAIDQAHNPRKDLYNLHGYTIQSQNPYFNCYLKTHNDSAHLCTEKTGSKEECKQVPEKKKPAPTGEQLAVSLDNLWPSTQYHLTLTPWFLYQNTCRTSVVTDFDLFSTTQAVIKTVNMTTVAHKEISVTWDADEDHPNVTYTVYVIDDLSQTVVCTKNSSSRLNSCLGQVNLTFWQYNITIKATSDRANFSVSKQVEDEEARAAVDQVSITKNDTSVSMEIEVLEKVNISVDILQYLVESSHPDFGCLVLYKTTATHLPCGLQQSNRCVKIHKKKVRQTRAPPHKFTAVLDNLWPSTLYNFRLTPWICLNNVSRPGSPTPFGPINTSSAGITNITANATGTKEMTVTWTSNAAHPNVTYTVCVTDDLKVPGYVAQKLTSPVVTQKLCEVNSSSAESSCKGENILGFWNSTITIFATSLRANFSARHTVTNKEAANVVERVEVSDSTPISVELRVVEKANLSLDPGYYVIKTNNASFGCVIVRKHLSEPIPCKQNQPTEHEHCRLLQRTNRTSDWTEQTPNENSSSLHADSNIKTMSESAERGINSDLFTTGTARDSLPPFGNNGSLLDEVSVSTLAGPWLMDDLWPSTNYTFELKPWFCYKGALLPGNSTIFQAATLDANVSITNVTPTTSQISVAWDTTVAIPNVTYSVHVADALNVPDTQSQNISHSSQRKEFLCSVESSSTAINSCRGNFSARPFWEYVIIVSAVSKRVNITSYPSIVVTPPSKPGKVDGLQVFLLHNNSDLNCSGEIIANYSAACVTWSDVIPKERYSFIANYTLTVTSGDKFKHNSTVESNFGWLASNLTAYRLNSTQTAYWAVIHVKPNDTNTVTVCANGDATPANETFHVEVPEPAVIEQAEVEKKVLKDKIVPSRNGTLAFVINDTTFLFKDNKGHQLNHIFVIKEGALPPSRVDLEAVDNYPDYEHRHGDQAKDQGYRVHISINESDTRQTVVVGNENCSSKSASKYCNGPLDTGNTYSVWGVLCNDVNCGVLVLVKEAKIPGAEEEQTPSWATTLIGIGVVVASLLVILIVYRCCYYERRLPKESNLSEWTQIEQRSKRPMKLVSLEAVIARKQRDNNLLLREEYEDLTASTKGVKVPHAVGASEKNRTKNRWADIVTYDHSRVKISKCEDGCDYINANFMPGYNREHEYIATQGPLPFTINHFWKMVWEYEVPVIVMLTETREGAKVKCEQYWPDQKNDVVQYGDIVVSNVSYLNLGDYNITILALSHVKDKKRQLKVHHFQYLHWLDMTASLTPAAMTDFIKDVRQHLPAKPAGPTIVHCSAGVGRTGTYIAIDYAMQLINQQPLSAELDIYGFIMRLRQARVLMVQTANQYILIHLCARYWMTAQREKAALENGTGMTRASSMTSLARQSTEVKRMTHFGPVTIMFDYPVAGKGCTIMSQVDLDVTRMTYMDEEGDEAETDVDMGLGRVRSERKSTRKEVLEQWSLQNNGNNGNSESSLLLP